MTPPTTPTDKLIAALSEAVAPVKRLPPPEVRAGKWLAFAACVVGVLVAMHGPREDLAVRFADPAFVVPWIASVLVGLTAAFAAFQMSVPGSKRSIELLPALPLAVWLGTLGTGCAAELSDMGSAAFGTSWACFKFIVLTGSALGIAMALMLRKAAPLAPSRTLAMGALAAASFASAGLEIFHHLQTSTMVLIWHLGTVAFVTLVALPLGGRALGKPA
jgi:hypothetical protein